jgi:hypothetical protein
MLFQGTRDDLADLNHSRPVCERLGERATLVGVQEADHSFHVPARNWSWMSGRASERSHGLIRDVLLKGPLKTVSQLPSDAYCRNQLAAQPASSDKGSGSA